MNYRHSLVKWFRSKELLKFYALDMGGRPIIIFMWDSNKSLQRMNGKSLLAVCHTSTEGGAIHFSLDNIGSGIVAHEIYHAAKKYLKDIDEEKAAVAFAEFTKKFWVWFYSNFEEKRKINNPHHHDMSNLNTGTGKRGEHTFN